MDERDFIARFGVDCWYAERGRLCMSSLWCYARRGVPRDYRQSDASATH